PTARRRAPLCYNSAGPRRRPAGATTARHRRPAPPAAARARPRRAPPARRPRASRRAPTDPTHAARGAAMAGASFSSWRLLLYEGGHSPAGARRAARRSLCRRLLFEGDRVVFAFVQYLESLLQAGVAGLREDQPVEHPLAGEDQPLVLAGHADTHFILRDVIDVEGPRLVGVVERVAFRQTDRHGVAFDPGVVEVNLVLARAGGEQRRDALLEERR